MSVPAPGAKHAYRPDVDGLRAIAVLSVFLVHASPRTLPGGFMGVDVFFVISGYLITGIILERLARGEFSIRDFYARRIRRIFPALSIVLATVLIVGWMYLLPHEYADAGIDAAASAGFVANLRLWASTSYFGVDAQSKFLLHLWSLGVEEQYYLGWPLLLMLLWRTRKGMLFIPLILLASFALNIYETAHSPKAAFYSPLPRLWELLIGSLLTYATFVGGEPIDRVVKALRGSSGDTETFARVSRNGASLVGIIMLAVGFAVVHQDAHFPGFWVILPTIGTMLIIAAGPDTWLARKILSNRILVFIGLISYPLYLWHWPMLVLLRVQFPDAPRLIKLLALGSVFVAAYLTYRLVETPIRRSRKPRTVFTLCAAQAVLLMAGLLILQRSGVPSRGSQLFQRIARVNLGKGVMGAEMREGTCFLRLDQAPSAFGHECFPPNGPDSVPSVLLWGDSFAAHYAPALEKRHDIRFGQLTSGACPPLLTYTGREHDACVAINAFIASWVKANAPDVVVLAARWNRYRDFARVDSTLALLQASGVDKIIVIGSSAQFGEEVPRLLVRRARDGMVPERLPGDDMRRIVHNDSVLRSLAAKHGATFVAPIATECNRAGCLASLDSYANRVTTWDDGHLTETGAEWIINSLMQNLFIKRYAASTFAASKGMPVSQPAAARLR